MGFPTRLLGIRSPLRCVPRTQGLLHWPSRCMLSLLRASATSSCLCAHVIRTTLRLTGWVRGVLGVCASEINVGLDETFDLGKGRSRSECRSRGIQHVYLDYLLNVHKYIAGMGKRMQYWGDIVLHHPDIIGKLPRVSTGCAKLTDKCREPMAHVHPDRRMPPRSSGATRGIIRLTLNAHYSRHTASRFTLCPAPPVGTALEVELVRALLLPASATTMTRRGVWGCVYSAAAIANLRSAALAGRQHGAIGFLNADWGDNGHLQTLTSAFLGLAGADVSWNPDADTSRERVVHVLGTHVLRERAPQRGHAAALYDLGNTYRQVSNSDVYVCVCLGSVRWRLHLMRACRYTRAFNLNGTLMYYLMLVPEALLALALRKLVGMALHDRPCCRRVVGVAASRFGLGLLLALLFAVCVGLPLFAVGVFPGAVSMAGAFAMALAVGALLFVPTAYMVLGHALLCCGRVTSRGWRRARDHVERMLDNPGVVAASGADMAVADADTIAQEVLWTAQLLGWMVRYAQLRTSMGLGHVGCASRRRRSGFARDLAKLASRHRELWTRRCRREGVDSSAARFDLTVCVLEGGRYDSSATHGLQVAVDDDGPSDASTPLSASAVRRGGCTERARACGGPVVGATCCCCWCGQSCC